MKAFEIVDLMEKQGAGERPYLEFIREPTLSVGLYMLPAGENDPQQPHNEDEIYYIIGGRGHIFVGGEERNVQPGSIIYVPAGIEHRFHTITEKLTILVFFAPAETN